MLENKMYPKIKRKIDVLLSIIMLLILWPLFLIISLLIKFDSSGPILFKQKRVGIHKTHFEILKFRTMKSETPNEMPTHQLTNAELFITRTGSILRKTSLDELPQIINILKGEMSFVGPRPALWNQYDLIDERERYHANDVLPGLTGWAQVNGRDELPIAVKAKLDGDYAKSTSLIFDIKIFIKTVFSVIKSDGVKEGKMK